MFNVLNGFKWSPALIGKQVLDLFSRQTSSCTRSCRGYSQLRVSNPAHMVLDCGVKLDNQTHRKALGQGSNPQPSGCEATVLLAAPPSHITANVIC